MTTYVYKSTTGHPVNIDNFTITPNPGLQLKYPNDILDAYLGTSINRYDDGVLVSSDPESPVMARKTLTGGIVFSAGERQLAFPNIHAFENFAPSIFASLVTGATYEQVGTVVTVTATAHGLPTNKNGFRIFWPGSVDVAAGWYDGYAYIGANTYSFTNPETKTVAAGAAITGTLPCIAETQVSAMTLQKGCLLSSGSLAKLNFFRSGDTTAAAKKLRMLVGGSVVAESSLTSTPLLSTSKTIYTNGGKIVGSSAAADGSATSNSSQYSPLVVDFENDLIISLSLSLTNSAQWVSLEAAKLEIM